MVGHAVFLKLPVETAGPTLSQTPPERSTTWTWPTFSWNAQKAKKSLDKSRQYQPHKSENTAAVARHTRGSKNIGSPSVPRCQQLPSFLAKPQGNFNNKINNEQVHRAASVLPCTRLKLPHAPRTW